MKRVAICLSGHLRNFQRGFLEINNSIIQSNNQYKFDFFLSTWSDQDWRTDNYKKTNEIIEKFKLIYDPVDLEIEEHLNWDTKKYLQFVRDSSWLKKDKNGIRTKGEHILSMFYKIKRSNDLKSNFESINDFEYDLVIRTRTDVCYNQTINLDNLIKDSKDTIFVSKSSDSAKKKDNIEFSDVFAISSSKNMNIYSSVFDHLYDVVEKYQIFRPEPILNNFLIRENKDSFVVKDLLNDWFVFP